MQTLTITLADGTEHSRTVRRPVRSWKSWLMRQLPYGTDFQGATFNRESTNPNAGLPQDERTATDLR